MNTVHAKDIEVKKLDTSEILRYMRAGMSPDAQVVLAAERGGKLVLGASGCRACYTKVLVERIDEAHLKLGQITVCSNDLLRHLEGCFEAFVIGVSAGVGVDRIIRSSRVESELLSLACDAAGSTLVEEACDQLEEFLSEEIKALGRTAVGRFSPGYGDFSLEYQKHITKLLNTSKNIGASLTGGVMMAPSKTVTAIIGIK
ncbi:MAG: hypothetical protein E7667_02785 [Ruminococcaceae bacterium]|nr:hypothetical protein [Oscillospiraceae bacterium]